MVSVRIGLVMMMMMMMIMMMMIMMMMRMYKSERTNECEKKEDENRMKERIK